MKNHIICYCIIIISAIFSSATAQNNLSDVQQEINVVQKNLEEQRTTRLDLQKKLKASEEYVSQLTLHHQETKAELKQEADKLNLLQEKQVDYEKKFVAQQQEIATQMRTAYASQNNEFLKILLSQKNTADVQRNLVYYHYFLKKRLALVDVLRHTVRELQENAADIQKNTHMLLGLQKQQQTEINRLQDAQHQRNQVLEKIETNISSDTDRLAVLEQNRKALETVVVDLKVKTTSSLPERHYAVRGSFSKGKGKMKWPAQGKIIEGFDSTIEGSQLKLHGVLISAPQGEKIHAIAPGRVVFSQWMSGYGLLVIVDHGDGYMTLYGRNDVVYRKIGDKVSAGDVLATVGSSGGYSKPALYFAIREDGKAIDPAGWCRA